MPSRTLLLFCKFLAQRVRTENLDLLYNIAVDVVEDPPCFTRVEEMVYRVFPLVAIVPTETVDTPTRAKADKLLHRMRERATSADDANELHNLHMALRDRIELKNWDVLEQIYSEFKVGHDHTLRAFVALQPQAIVIVPMRPSKPRTTDSADSRQTNSFAVKSEMKPDPGRVEVPEHEAAALKPLTHFRQDTPPATFEILCIIRAELDAIEASAPWDRVYDVSKIVYPFDDKKFPLLAERFNTFWSRYGRSVWQRKFWCRVPTNDRDDVIRQIKDKAAARAFVSWVIIPLFKAFGAAFFVDLDARPTPLRWWWYRGPIVNLVQMASVEGIDYCKRYLQTQYLKPHPTPHPQFHLETTHRPPQSPSMWVMSTNKSHILDAVVRLKQRPKPPPRKARTGRKRTRAADSDEDEDE